MPGQLRMTRTHYADLPPLDLPAGYALRCYGDGDEGAWADVVNSVGDLGNYDAARARAFMMSKPQFDPEALQFITFEGTPVATACAWRDHAGETQLGQLHMVAVDPAHRGKRLGTHVSTAVIRYFESHGFASLYLMTDDWRLPAVKTYLQLGFEPRVDLDEGLRRFLSWTDAAYTGDSS